MEGNNLFSQEHPLFGYLHSDLQDYMDDEPSCEIFHPLITVSLYLPITKEQIEHINARYSYIEGLAQNAIKEKRFGDYLHLVQRSYRLDTFADEVAALLTDRQYWESLADVWMDTEFPHQGYDLWYALFATKRPQRKMVMNEAERSALSAMRQILTIYRGGLTANGLSWTLSEEKARWFANRFNRNRKHQVFKGTVPKNKVYAYLNRRKEQEIVVNPKFVTLE